MPPQVACSWGNLRRRRFELLIGEGTDLQLVRKLKLLLRHVLRRGLSLIRVLSGRERPSGAIILLEALLLVHLGVQGHLLSILWEGRGVALGPLTSHRAMPHQSLPHMTRLH